ncbi:MAG TPA: hypothetical protein VFH88_03310 [Candidatus Krumholzibacteria bacterium]|nr:hypothetical protein [Candidatus Krumholzibacteria bacterium]
MKKILLLFLVVATAMTTVVSVSSAGSSIGGGLHYLHAVKDIDKNTTLDKNSFSILGSYMFGLGLVSVEAQVEYVFNYAGTDHSMWTPSAWAVTHGLIYAGAGIGIGYSNGDWQDDPFYALRAGVNLPLAAFKLDAYATYQFQNGGQLKTVTGEDLDSVTLAAILRFPLGK